MRLVPHRIILRQVRGVEAVLVEPSPRLGLVVKLRPLVLTVAPGSLKSNLDHALADKENVTGLSVGAVFGQVDIVHVLPAAATIAPCPGIAGRVASLEFAQLDEPPRLRLSSSTQRSRHLVGEQQRLHHPLSLVAKHTSPPRSNSRQMPGRNSYHLHRFVSKSSHTHGEPSGRSSSNAARFASRASCGAAISQSKSCNSYSVSGFSGTPSCHMTINGGVFISMQHLPQPSQDTESSMMVSLTPMLTHSPSVACSARGGRWRQLTADLYAAQCPPAPPSCGRFLSSTSQSQPWPRRGPRGGRR